MSKWKEDQAKELHTQTSAWLDTLADDSVRTLATQYELTGSIEQLRTELIFVPEVQTVAHGKDIQKETGRDSD